MAVLSVLVEFCHGGWACEKNNGWLHYVDNGGNAVCRADSFRANCNGEFSILDRLLPAAFLLNIYHDPTCPCVQTYPHICGHRLPQLFGTKKKEEKKQNRHVHIHLLNTFTGKPDSVSGSKQYGLHAVRPNHLQLCQNSDRLRCCCKVYKFVSYVLR